MLSSPTVMKEKNSGSEMEQEITEHGVNEELDGIDAYLEDTGSQYWDV